MRRGINVEKLQATFLRAGCPHLSEFVERVAQEETHGLISAVLITDLDAFLFEKTAENFSRGVVIRVGDKKRRPLRFLADLSRGIEKSSLPVRRMYDVSARHTLDVWRVVEKQGKPFGLYATAH
ncbi:MAG: hypothetical protein AAB691_01255 [Patescibacteria group bacterium]